MFIVITSNSVAGLHRRELLVSVCSVFLLNDAFPGHKELRNFCLVHYGPNWAALSVHATGFGLQFGRSKKKREPPRQTVVLCLFSLSSMQTSLFITCINAVCCKHVHSLCCSCLNAFRIPLPFFGRHMWAGLPLLCVLLFFCLDSKEKSLSPSCACQILGSLTYHFETSCSAPYGLRFSPQFDTAWMSRLAFCSNNKSNNLHMWLKYPSFRCS